MLDYFQWDVFEVKPEAIEHLKVNIRGLMSFYSVTKLNTSSPLNIKNRFMFEQHSDLLEMYFQNKDNWANTALKTLLNILRKTQNLATEKKQQQCVF